MPKRLCWPYSAENWSYPWYCNWCCSQKKLKQTRIMQNMGALDQGSRVSQRNLCADANAGFRFRNCLRCAYASGHWTSRVKTRFFGRFSGKTQGQRRIGTFQDSWNLCLQASPVLTNWSTISSLCWGHRVCKESWMHMLAIGRQRLQRCKNTIYGKDARSLGRL